MRVITKGGNRFRGVLNDVTDDYLYIEPANPKPRQRYEYIPLAAVRKVVIRRSNKKAARLTGAILGGLVIGFVANESLKKYPVRSSVSYGVTLTAAAAAGAGAGLLLGSVMGNASNRVVRPLDPDNPEITLQRQLEPFSLRYQNEIINYRPNNSQ